ncbi:MAG: hypothetical protein CL607_13905 [Anaerolineaceae bacterium]|nr:hypothetical protein [Anaerolineaceae bacterium]
MRSYKLDKDALVRRNQMLTAAFHQRPLQHMVRHYMLRSMSKFPYTPLPKPMNRILFIKPDHIGDMLLATPAIRAVKQADTATEIHVLAGPWAANILANYKEIDRVLTINFPGFDRNEEKTSMLAPYQYLIHVSRNLRRLNYSAAIILRPDHWWGAMLAHASGIRRRIGYNVKDVSPFLSESIPLQNEHVIQQNMRLVDTWADSAAPMDIHYTFEPSDEDRDYAASYLQHVGISKKRLLCVHPGSGSWTKLWEDEKWAAVADTLTEQFDFAVIFTGTMAEQSTVTSIKSHMRYPAFSAAGDLSLGQLAALYQHASAVLGADSGPMHLAAAVDAPTVSLFGPADPVEFKPWGDSDRQMVLTSHIGCRPCRILDWGDDPPEYHPCVRNIPVSDVLDAARRVMR